MPEITLEEYELMNRILSDTRTGWWKADYRLQTYFFSKQIMELTGLPSDRLSFADFLNRIRPDSLPERRNLDSYQKTSSGKKCAWRFYYHRLDTDRR